MRVRVPTAVVTLVAVFAAGAASTRLARLFERDAEAQSARQPASVYVPAEGLAFRSLEGRIVARLSYDARGGSFEVYDNHERPAGALRAGFASEALPAAIPAPIATMTMPPGIPDLGY
jgi:hypothetical protein